MKKALSVILSLSLGLGITACGYQSVRDYDAERGEVFLKTEETEETVAETVETTVAETTEITETTETTRQASVIDSMSIDEVADMLFAVVSIPAGCEYDYDDQLRNDGANPVNYRQYRIQNADCYDGTTFNYTYSINFQIFEEDPSVVSSYAVGDSYDYTGIAAISGNYILTCSEVTDCEALNADLNNPSYDPVVVVNTNFLASYSDPNLQAVYDLFVELGEVTSLDEITTDSPAQISASGREYITFGSYEQDGDLSNGPEPIEWEVLSVEDGRMLVVSRYILDCQQYNSTRTDVTWETCSLREWLNGEFYNTAFTAEEQDRIVASTITNSDNPENGNDGGNDTVDNVFCLSVEEVLQYYDFNHWDDSLNSGNCQALITDVTPYAESQGVTHNSITEEDYYGIPGESYMSGLGSVGFTEDVIGLGCGPWWLRSSGIYGYTALIVSRNGYTAFSCIDQVEDTDMGVRPAMYIEQ